MLPSRMKLDTLKGSGLEPTLKAQYQDHGGNVEGADGVNPVRGIRKMGGKK